jgi:hypothetical protein
MPPSRFYQKRVIFSRFLQNTILRFFQKILKKKTCISLGKCCKLTTLFFIEFILNMKKLPASYLEPKIFNN